ncbi:DUF3299 domain-containing protein [Edaphobacter flagellatus]|uniref:DUF3299 domain-containing protein n=1 Tax=Edaphobacter flagellatus TaxID=1933044 RepID=UPI0021B18FBA|nr:DUF3299 domain-containing protein [Edaphobacter flagellatus]
MKRIARILATVLLADLLLAAPPGAVTVGWSTLKTLTSAQTSSPARALDNKLVSVPGFMVPLEDDADQVTEFILVPFAGACIHVPPPPPNQMIYVKLQHNKKTKMSFTEPISVTGRLHVTTVDSPYGDISFSMDGESVGPYTE